MFSLPLIFDMVWSVQYSTQLCVCQLELCSCVVLLIEAWHVCHSAAPVVTGYIDPFPPPPERPQSHLGHRTWVLHEHGHLFRYSLDPGTFAQARGTRGALVRRGRGLPIHRHSRACFDHRSKLQRTMSHC